MSSNIAISIPKDLQVVGEKKSYLQELVNHTIATLTRFNALSYSSLTNLY